MSLRRTPRPPSDVWLRRAVIAALLVAASGVLAGCGTGAAAATPPSAPPALPASAVPYLPSSAHAVSSDTLVKDADVPGLAGKLAAFHFVNGSQRLFQGRSHKLDLVDSRTLEFGSARDAAGFVRFVRANAGSYVGQIPVVKPTRSGVVIVGPTCGCHLSTPVLLGLFNHGKRVTWLEINGPGASRASLLALAAEAS
jgi:hypothetical protein